MLVLALTFFHTLSQISDMSCVSLVILTLAATAAGQPLNSLRSSSGVDNSVFIAVKTSAKFHKSRLTPVLETWHRGASEQTFFFTDSGDDADLEAAVGGGHLINTGCADDHSRQALSCKMEAELETFLEASWRPQWFCHVDDDNYVNTRRLAAMLSGYSAEQDWYLGKVSIPKKLEILDRLRLPQRRQVSFWFATGGAGFCLSRPLVEKMRPWVTGGRFQKLADDIRLPDDVAVGYLIEVLLGVELTQVKQFHSHLEPLRLVNDPADAITLSYSTYEDTDERNIVELEGREAGNEMLGKDGDETRFYAVHCHLYPEECPLP